MKVLYMKKKRFYLLVSFPEFYPNEPPDIRFITIPYHLNIGFNGQICMSKLKEDYLPKYHVIDLVQEVSEMLLLPDYFKSLDINQIFKFQYEKQIYNDLAKKSSNDIGEDEYQNYLKTSQIDSDI